MMVKYICLVVFVLITVGIGLYSHSKVKNVNDFFLGSRSMGPWITAFSYGTAYFSAVIFIGYAGNLGWSFGLPATWIGIGNAIIGSLLAWLVLAKRTRKMTHELNASTMPEFFEKRYASKSMKIVTALIIFVFLIPYSASVYMGLSFLFESVFGINYIYCMIAMAVLSGIYLILGGYVATALNDLFQGMIMLVGIVLVIIFVIASPEVGGLQRGFELIKENNPSNFSLFSGNPIGLFSLILLTSLGTWGLPQMVHKFYAIQEGKAIKTATIISTIFAFIMAGGSYFLGAFGPVFVKPDQIMEIGGRLNFDKVVPLMLISAKLPDLLMGIIALLVLSASMSTLSSLVLVSSSAISMDLLKGSLFKSMKNKTVMLLMRVFCIVFVILSVVIALTPNAIVTLMSFSWGTIAGSFLAPFLYGLYWKGTTRAGAWAGILTGLTVSISSTLLLGMDAKMAPMIGAVAMITSIIAVPVVSLMTKTSLVSMQIEATEVAATEEVV